MSDSRPGQAHIERACADGTQAADQRGADGAQAAERAGIAIIAFTRAGCALALRLAHDLAPRTREGAGCVTVHGPARYADEFGVDAYESLASWTAARFARAGALVFVGASGIAVRAIAPLVRDKFSDPAVVSIDEAGRFAVPLLSGHVGGANELARELARIAGGQAVVSTATDVNGLFAVDEWAARRGLRIVERAVAKEISARLLEGAPVGFATDLDFAWEPPAGVVAVASDPSAPDAPEVGFAVTLDDEWQPFARTLHLVPQAVTVGVGCRKDSDPAVVARAVDEALAKAHVSRHAVDTLASIDVKRAEPALLQLSSERGWDFRVYSAAELAAVPGEFEASEFVKRTVGVDNVCERSALAAGGRLLLGKQAGNGATVAIAVRGDGPLFQGDAART